MSQSDQKPSADNKVNSRLGELFSKGVLLIGGILSIGLIYKVTYKIEASGTRVETFYTEEEDVFRVFSPKTVVASKIKNKWGRYLKYRYYWKHQSYEWTVHADCQDYTADWQDDGKPWIKLKRKKASNTFDVYDAKTILDEFCPQMDRLVKEAKSGTKKYFRYPIALAEHPGNSGNSGNTIRALSGIALGVSNEMRMNRIKQNQRVIQQQQMYNQIDSYGSGGAGGGPGSYY